MQRHDAPPKSSQVGALEHRSISYSMAAAAAGVSLMALAAPAEGKVVITTHINIPVTSTVSLDLNHDGVADIQIGICGYSAGHFDCSSRFPLGAYSSNLSAKALHGGGILDSKQTGALNLARSAPIGKSGYFEQYGFMAARAGTAYTTANPIGNWGNGQPNRFLGVKILIHGTTHFGWVRITVKNPTTQERLTATITEYGYETIANKKVLAGLASNDAQDPEAKANLPTVNGASLGMLALGAEGIVAWRREENEAAVA
jgi:hypothetical protein